VVVVGAGYAGLAAALALQKAGRSVLVLEARDRPGGRCLNQHLPPPFERYVVEAGAEFIGPGHDRMYAFATQYGIDTFHTYNEGKLVSYLGGKRTEYSGIIPGGSLVGAAEAGIAMARLDAMAAEVPLEAPWSAKQAASWDGQTVLSWMEQNVLSEAGKSLIRLAVSAVFSAEPAELSLLYLLFYIRAAGNLEILIRTEGGAQQDRIVGGSQRIALAMAEALGDDLIYDTPVSAIEDQGDKVLVHTAEQVMAARHVVVAMAPWMAGRMRFSTQNPAMQMRLQLMQRAPMGTVLKVNAIYDKPFWRDAGLNGQITSDAFLPTVTFDSTPADPGAPGVLLGFINGRDARTALSMDPAARRQAVLEAFGVYFGLQATTPLGYMEKNWQEEAWSGGGPVGLFTPGLLTGYGPLLRQPTGRIHWAGTETAMAWTGYMEGAVRSGERAAQEVLGIL
jgi:monoamine oxidase